MKKIYTLFLITLIVFGASCKKDQIEKDPTNEPVKETDITLIGTWKMTKRLNTNYYDGKLMEEDINSLPKNALKIEFKSDGTGRSYQDNVDGDYALFNYETNNATYFTFTKYTNYLGGMLIYTNTEHLENSIKQLTTTELEFHTEIITSVNSNGVSKEVKQVYKQFFTRVK